MKTIVMYSELRSGQVIICLGWIFAFIPRCDLAKHDTVENYRNVKGRKVWGKRHETCVARWIIRIKQLRGGVMCGFYKCFACFVRVVVFGLAPIAVHCIAEQRFHISIFAIYDFSVSEYKWMRSVCYKNLYCGNINAALFFTTSKVLRITRVRVTLSCISKCFSISILRKMYNILYVYFSF